MSRVWALALGDQLTLPLAVALGRGVVRALGASLRVTEVNRGPVDRLWVEDRALIYAVWHGRMLMLPYLYGRIWPVHVLASRSRDGEVLARFVRGFGLRVVRGSSSRGAATALRTLARLLREQRAKLCIVPDGPRGPRCVAQPGAVLLAKLGRAPVVPIGFGVSRATVLASWDAFVIPHPFARAAVVFGDPLIVPGDANAAALEHYRQSLEAALQRVTLEADRMVSASRVPPL